MDASHQGIEWKGGGEYPEGEGWVAIAKGLAAPVNSLRLQISQGCVRVSVRHSGVMRPLRQGDDLINAAGFRTGRGEGS